VGAAVLAAKVALFIVSEAQGIASQSVLQLPSASPVVVAAIPVVAPEMANAGSELVLEHTSYAIPQNPFSK